MATTLWDPDRILQITKGPHDQGMFCLGRARSRYDSRCRWDIPYSDYQIIRKLLSQLARKLPHEISDDELKEIAERGLCDYHCGQVHEVVSGWHDTLASLQKLYSPYKDPGETRDTVFDALQATVKRSRDLLPPEEDSSAEDLSEYFGGHMREHSELVEAKKQRDLQTTREKDLEICLALLKERLALCEENDRLREQNCAHLQELLGEVKAELADVQGNNSILTCTISDLQGACDLKMRQITEITAELSNVRGNNSSLIDANEEMRKEVDGKKKQLNEVTVELSNVRRANERFRIFNEDMRKEINGKQEQIETITSQLASMSTDLDSTTKELSVACETKEKVQNDLHAALEEISNLQAQLTEIQIQQSTTIWCKIKRWIREKASWLSRDRRRRRIRDEDEEVALAPVKPSNLA
ncbi:hypothetical protein ASPFODRAFT_32082 [Aspergillus luchuensis CBS 106.47]|uniref:Uncharacterized protein n=1 Tax=Aspergillus luchuensis (strain CBS 106.47) TaxID=1137211 RepID=A0A1M3TKS3_ASPLC|nr:hypothetical protein ASPFODRAFT_32082 [Aspergillus luchuensis CBS 106.47]